MLLLLRQQATSPLQGLCGFLTLCSKMHVPGEEATLTSFGFRDPSRRIRRGKLYIWQHHV